MKVLFTLDEKNYTDDMPVFEKYAVRGIICRDGKYVMQQGSSGMYKIPGGGVDLGESYEETLIREVREEVGLVVIPSSIREIGEITELREDLLARGSKYVCHSLFYACEVEEVVLEPKMTDSERKAGFHPVWATLDQVIETNRALQNDEPRLNQKKPLERDTMFLEWLRDND